MGVDWGERRIGLALSDESQTLAQPLVALTRRAGKRFPMRQFLTLLERHSVATVVVGLPLDPEGTEGESAAAARALAGDIARVSGKPVDLWDERLTTSRALRAVREMGGSTKGRTTLRTAKAPSKIPRCFPGITVASWRSNSTNSSHLVANVSPAGNCDLRKYSRPVCGRNQAGCPSRGTSAPTTTQLCARTVAARFGHRAVYSWKVQVPQTSALPRCTLESSTAHTR